MQEFFGVQLLKILFYTTLKILMAKFQSTNFDKGDKGEVEEEEEEEVLIKQLAKSNK